MNPRADYGRIGILMGGPSSERGISLKSGRSVYESLKALDLDVVPIDISSDKAEENADLVRAHDIDCAFLALHGRFGEDGQIQDILQSLGIPYTGSGVSASRLAIDKIASRRILEVYNLAVPGYVVIEKRAGCDNLFPLLGRLGFPLVIKPAGHGSSIGLSIIDKKEDVRPALELAFQFDDRIIVEEYIHGRELTVGILDDRALPVIEIIPKRRFFDFEAKYRAGMTEYAVPAQLADNIAASAQNTAVQAHKLLGCYGCSRADIILSAENIPYILELNSIPGLTPTSLLPKAAKAAGIEFPRLCLKLIELAYEKAEVEISR